MSATPRSAVSAALAADRLGPASVTAFALTAAAPLMVVGGLLTAGWANIQVVGFPLALLLIGLVLTLFCFGYVAMAQRIPNAGAFYAYISQGLGRPTGVGASFVALLAYNALQIGLYGIFGVTLSMFLASKGITVAGEPVQWWLIALIAWALVAAFGVARVDLNSKVLLTLLGLELLVMVIYDIAFLATPAEGVSFAAFAPGNLFVGSGAVSAVFVIVVTAFIGFEAAPVFAEESRDARRTVRTATFTALFAMLAAYVISTWAITVATGPSNVVDSAAAEQQNLIFALAGERLAPFMADAGVILLVTSVFAAMLSFHNTCARYTFALAREGVLPTVLAVTGTRSGAPQTASVLQSTIGLIVISLFALLNLDPINQLFFWSGGLGGFGVLALAIATSLAVILYFSRRNGDGEPLWRWLFAPAVSTVVLGAIFFFVVTDFHNLIAVAPDHPLRWIFPLVFVVLFAIGVLVALVMKSTRPEMYASIGLGAEASASMSLPAPRPAITAPDKTKQMR